MLRPAWNVPRFARSPAVPSAPVSDAAAVDARRRRAPRAGERERTALALVALAGTARPAVAMRLGIGDEELAVSLARARKELRRTVAALPGSGWCERAERLISDRIDGALAERDEPRLDVHLRNCPRCVEHERRLVQATDALVAGVTPLPSRARAVAKREPSALAPVEAEPARPAEPVPTASAVGWNVLIVVAIVLALVVLALALAGALGVQL